LKGKKIFVIVGHIPLSFFFPPPPSAAPSFVR